MLHRRTPTFDAFSKGDDVEAEGAAAFQQFQTRVNSIDHKLQTLSNAVIQLGSSARLLGSAFLVRQRLKRILHLVRDNAEELFPRKVRKETLAGDELVRNFSRAKLRYKPPPSVPRPVVRDEIDAESFPEEIEGLANDMINFINCLNEFPEFTDEYLNASTAIFERDLKYRADCLREFEGQFRFDGVTRHVHDLSMEIGEHLKDFEVALLGFLDVALPTTRFAQEDASANILNLSTISIFFSGITATTLQFSFDQNATALWSLVNAFWLTSLVISVGSVMNSLLGILWRRRIYSSPEHRVPRWIIIWIDTLPLVLLFVSAVAFTLGLLTFTYASGQRRVVCIVVTALTACTSFRILSVSIWWALERWAYAQYKGQFWLDDILSGMFLPINRLLTVSWALIVASMDSAVLRAQSSKLHRYIARGFSIIRRRWQGAMSTPQTAADVESRDSTSRTSTVDHDVGMHTVSPAPAVESASIATRSDTPISPDTPHVNTRGIPSPVAPEPDTPDGSGPSSTPLRCHRLKSAMRSVMLMPAAAPGRPTLFPLSHKRQATLRPHPPTTSSQRSNAFEPSTAGRLARIGILKQALLSVAPAQSIKAHQNMMRRLAFSPNGKFLATCSWDRTSTILKVADLSSHRVLAHPHGFVGQVMWSPNGSLLLTKLSSEIDVWTEDGVCKQRIERCTAVHSITWFANGTELLSIEANEAVHLDVKGKVLHRYPFERLRLHDVAITPDGERLFAVATLEHSKDGYKPVKARVEKRIVVYNRPENEIEHQVPLLHDVRGITISNDSRFALVSYEHKAPPQLWRIGMVKGDARLALLHTYMPNQETDFAGPGYFGGKDDQLIFCASKAGDIHIWDRESGTLLRHIRPRESDGESLTCTAWNHASDDYMFATGSHDGTVRLWHMPNTAAAGRHSSIIEHEPIESLRVAEASTSSRLADLGPATDAPARISDTSSSVIPVTTDAEVLEEEDDLVHDEQDRRNRPERTVPPPDPLSHPPDDVREVMAAVAEEDEETTGLGNN